MNFIYSVYIKLINSHESVMQINITKMIGYHYHHDFYGDLAFVVTGQRLCTLGWFPFDQQLTRFLT